MSNKVSVISLLLAVLCSSGVSATGIPVFDAAAQMKMAVDAVEQARQALAQLQEAKRAIEQARSQYEHYKGIATGNDRLGEFLKDPALNEIFPMRDWQDVYHDAKNLPELRERYALTSPDPRVQAAFDQLLQQVGSLEKAYDASNERVKNAEHLRARMDTAITPQQKQDLAIRFQQENLELQNQQIRLENMKLLMEQKNKIEDKKRAADFKSYMLGQQ
ncbi:P-type DNA transfer protein VirB5 [Aeromonas salmonicida]|jgi:type IV secretion system protein VirB5|uniref:P-type DNA transfer protein VirB5 n=1 Tax=Aeromonas salmonicida TaxID=645 RepID=UPI000B3FB1A3|nr:P-type DNA transfer protein VirB5 [Aeromonas salmonicida]ARW85333.1 P-type DNA transfer protein VirB5 [Aeromonas salmonicida]